MTRRVRTCLTWGLTLVFVCSLGALILGQLQYHRSAQSCAAARELLALPSSARSAEEAAERTAPTAERPKGPERPETAEEPVPEKASYGEAMAQLDLTALQERNGDVIGWIFIPETEISYPVLQGNDNERYLNYTWDEKRNSAGSIFLDCRSSGGFDDFHAVLYGHRMRNGTMFAELKHYADAAYREEHPHVYISDGTGCLIYTVFAAYEADGTWAPYRFSFADEGERRAFLEQCVKATVIDTGIVPDVQDRILTLSTCTGVTYDARWVVQAVLTGRVERT